MGLKPFIGIFSMHNLFFSQGVQILPMASSSVNEATVLKILFPSEGDFLRKYPIHSQIRLETFFRNFPQLLLICKSFPLTQMGKQSMSSSMIYLILKSQWIMKILQAANLSLIEKCLVLKFLISSLLETILLEPSLFFLIKRVWS